MNNIVIREAVPQDLPTLLDFEQQLISAERPLDVTMRTQHFHYYDIGKMITDPEAAVVVAELDGRLIASGHAVIREAKAYNRFDKYAFLGFQFTVPDQRGKGVNQLILNALVEWAKLKQLDEVRLQVYDENVPAVAAYEKVGFKKILTEMRLTVPF
ncbi:GNAT family N-acetyltransferase [Dyadobacter sp. CY326]|uniref:GNAT family N-acetyltransferase n=1 Tax=Dyadobacter sp. CY326 TaxID=2907300 RepID=UPI001F30FB6F|nr:GNAT family N-acetyltransferase [Dyadobacter sp. CY326]MCE7066617.1 GNAT family N-acetyltransferase [Dyadobacter sp. CY326]